MNLLAKILADHQLQDTPPVFIDIGASGSLPRIWQPLAKISTCIAIDGDAREFEVDDSGTSGWRRLITVDKVIVPKPQQTSRFHLTRSPYCSSTLQPNTKALSPYYFRSAFEVLETMDLPSTTLGEVLSICNLKQIDWFKTDSQGTDLRLLESLSSKVIDGILVMNLEPGIIDAYYGEDKLSDVLAHMNSEPFFLSEMRIRPVHMSSQEIELSFGRIRRKLLTSVLPESPGWAELTYIRNGQDLEPGDRRTALLLWLFSTLLGQHAHAWRIALKINEHVDDSLLRSCQQYSWTKLHSRHPQFAWGLTKVLSHKLRKTMTQGGE